MPELLVHWFDNGRMFYYTFNIFIIFVCLCLLSGVFLFYSDHITDIITDTFSLRYIQIILTILLMYIIAVIVQILKNRLSPLSFFVTSIIPLSIIYLMLFCPWSTPDASQHIAASYRFSNLILGNEDWLASPDDAEYISTVYKRYESTRPVKDGYQGVIDNFKNPIIRISNQNSLIVFPIIESRMNFYSVFNYLL